MLYLSIILALIHVSAGARILAAVPTPSYSHQIVFQPIFKELAKRGHEVVVLTTDPQNDPNIANLKEIDWSSTYDIWRNTLPEIIDAGKNPFVALPIAMKMLENISTTQFEHPEFKALLKNESEHFDLVMIELSVPVMFALKHRFNCPMIGLQSMDTFYSSHLSVGNAVHQILYPESTLAFSENMTFFNRLISFIMAHTYDFFLNVMYLNFESYKVIKYFGEGYPSLIELRDSVDMIFINVNIIFNNIRPVTPATVTIGGGLHIKESKPLPKDLQTYLDSREVIYFSLGSNVKSTDIPIEVREKLLTVFSELPYNVLWKFESEDMPNKPKNVKIQKWIPQQDVLKHPNVKLFVTQGGLQSLEEALFSHVPLVVMPIFADQESNAGKIVSKGLGLSIDQTTLTEEEFKSTLLEVITNPKYKNKAIELATRAKDEPMNALEKAVWWTEYVLRNKGAQHLKGPRSNLPLYQYYYLDIFAFIICILLVVSALFYFITKKIVSFVCRVMFAKKEKLH